MVHLTNELMSRRLRLVGLQRVQKYRNLPLHYFSVFFMVKPYVNSTMYHCSLLGRIMQSFLGFQMAMFIDYMLLLHDEGLTSCYQRVL